MDDHYATLALGYLRGINHQYLHHGLTTGKSPSELLQASEIISSAGAGRTKSLERELESLRPRIQKALEFLDRRQIGIVALGDPEYPVLLAETPSPPAFLYFLGSLELLSLPQIAIVGSRSSSRLGQRQTYEISGELARGGFGITSGLALGIDAAAHRGALDSEGETIAVMGTGLDQVYPARNRKLAEQIELSGGALVSEFPPGIPPRRENFPRRNRIVSGLSCAVLVVEAQARSGSLITARLATEQGRTVCALPGGINDPLKAGCHRLIREGAVLVRDAADIAEAASDLLGAQYARIRKASVTATATNHHLIDAMGVDPCSFEQLIELSGLSVAELSRELGELEVMGEIYRSAEGYRRIC